MAGIAMGSAIRDALAARGIEIIGHQWLWAPGEKGYTFEPHRARDKFQVFNPDGFVGDNAAEWGALPGQGVNADYCMCTTRWILRGPGGKFVKVETALADVE